MNSRDLEAIITKIIAQEFQKIDRRLTSFDRRLAALEQSNQQSPQSGLIRSSQSSDIVSKQQMQMMVDNSFQQKIVPVLKKIVDYVEYKTEDESETVIKYRNHVMDNNAAAPRQIQSGPSAYRPIYAFDTDH